MRLPDLVDGLELAGFLVVNVVLLAVLMGVAITLAAFLCVPDRTLSTFTFKKKPRTHESTVRAGAQS